MHGGAGGLAATSSAKTKNPDLEIAMSAVDLAELSGFGFNHYVPVDHDCLRWHS